MILLANMKIIEMYKLEILPIAIEDIENIIQYISYNLVNVAAAKKQRDLFMKSIENIITFPYGSTIYKSKKNLKFKYRFYKIKNYLIIYTINKKENLITIVRVLYQKMDISSILE